MARKLTKTSRRYLLTHLFASVKAKQEGTTLSDDLAKADFIAAARMPKQRIAAEDPSRLKAVRSPRRTGKSWWALSVATEGCLRKKGAVWVIVGLSRPSIKEIFWSLLKRMAKELELGLHFLETELIAQFPNGSKILFRGAETRSEIEKLRGGQYDGVIIDECKSFSPVVFTELIQDVVEPALGDRKGQLIVIGTPGDQLAGPFYEATCDPPIEFVGGDGVKRHSNHIFGTPVTLPYVWSLHTWTLRDNVECPWLWEEAQQRKALRGWTDDHPTWRREYLGHWVASHDRIVYRYNPRVHDYDGVFPEDFIDPVYVLGLDIGYRDADAIVVWAYSRHSFDVYQVYGEKRSKQNITQLAGWLREVRDTWCGPTGPEIMVYDPAGGGLKVIDELATIHGLYFDSPADKKDKVDYIELFNNELDAKRIHLLRDGALGTEMLENRWLEKSIGTPRKVEDPKTPNDLCDAALYAWRVCDHRRPTPPDRRPESNTREWWLAYKAEQIEKAVKQHNARVNRDDDYSQMDTDWWNRRPSFDLLT